MHGQFVEEVQGDQSTKEGDTISFEGCACSPLKKGREANSSKKNVKPIRLGGHTGADDGGEDYGFL